MVYRPDDARDAESLADRHRTPSVWAGPIVRLALRNALVPVLTVIGLTLAYLLWGPSSSRSSSIRVRHVRGKSIRHDCRPSGIALFRRPLRAHQPRVGLAQAWVDPRIRLA
jgi:hypothetical protein